MTLRVGVLCCKVMKTLRLSSLRTGDGNKQPEILSLDWACSFATVARQIGARPSQEAHSSELLGTNPLMEDIPMYPKSVTHIIKSAFL